MPYKDPADQKAWHAANRAKMREYQARYRARKLAEDPDFRAYQREASQRSKTKHRRAATDRQLDREARKRDQFIEHVDRSVLYEMHGGMCGICKEFIEGAFHVDHRTPVSRGGMHGYVNCQPAHPVCNLRKYNKEEALCVSG